MTELSSPNKTIFPDQFSETYKINKTSGITNEAFLETIFGSVEQDAQPILVSFVENPSMLKNNSVWKGLDRRRALQSSHMHNENNNYFSLSIYDADEKGFYSRKRKSFSALYAVMFDDVGTKVPIERIMMESSVMIETSPGNSQVIYILSTPVTDKEQAEKFMKAVIAAGLCDPGAGGPTARLARLPCAVNSKHTPLFPCRLRLWKPENRYSMGELIAGYGLADYLEEVPAASREKNKAPRPAAGDPVHFPVANENPALSALKKRGLYKTPFGDGIHGITCPWVHEHTNAADDGAAYFEPDDSYAIGGFKCHHGHCHERHIKELLEFLEVAPKAACMKPTIYATPGEMAKIIDAAEYELAKTLRYFQRGGCIVIISTDPGTKETKIYEIKQSGIRVAMAVAANWERYDKRSESMVAIDPPVHYPNALFDQPSYKYLPVLQGLARQPYLRPDGTLMLSPDYDPDSGMYGVFTEKDFFVPEHPTREQAQEALVVIQGLLNEFCFKGETDRAAALSGILTAAVRVSLPKAPMFHTSAPQIGSGKSYLGTIIATFCTPHSVAPTTFPQDEEECKKLLFAELLKSPAAINFDNMTVDLFPFPSMCAVLTEENFSARMLGVSKMASVSTRTLFLSSGNNVGPVQDMGRRTITITLDAKCEAPETKEYNNPKLYEDLLAQRGKYVSAALTIIRAWIVAGRPQQPCKRLVSYNEWIDLCCQPLMWLGLPNPMVSALQAIGDDPDRAVLSRLMEYWQDCFGKRPVMVRELVTESFRNPELREILEDIAPDAKLGISNKSLGRWIKRHENRVIADLRLVPDTAKRSAQAWRLEMVS